MPFSKTLLTSATLLVSLGLAGPMLAQGGSDTLSLDEAKTAAAEKFAKLDKDSDGSLEPAELKGVIGDKAFKAADADNDGTIDKNEYLALVEKHFKRADVDHDGSVDVKELNGPNGRMLKHLIH